MVSAIIEKSILCYSITNNGYMNVVKMFFFSTQMSRDQIDQSAACAIARTAAVARTARRASPTCAVIKNVSTFYCLVNNDAPYYDVTIA